jgi:CHAT domain-containing protein
LSRIQGTENPLIRSGFVLAGANAATNDHDSLGLDDGWVSAEEVATLDLHGTELVILSGCDTGLGDVRLGEGVSGLRRAFRYAGARSLIMSLAAVGDEATRTLMKRLYAGLAAGRGKLEALRQAQLSVLRDQRKRIGEGQPWRWATFVLVGDPK